MPTKLRAVEAGEAAPARKMLSIYEAAESDDRLEELRSMRRRIALALDNPNTAARDLASLSRRQIELGRDIDSIVAKESGESDSDQVTDEDFDAAAI